MYKKLIVVLMTVFTLCAFMLLPATTSAHAASSTRPAHAISSTAQQHAKSLPRINVVDCNGRSDFLQVYTTSGEICFANSGYMGVQLYGVYAIYSGNNAGWILYYQGGGAQPWYFNNNQSINLDPSVTEVTQIYIY